MKFKNTPQQPDTAALVEELKEAALSISDLNVLERLYEFYLQYQTDFGQRKGRYDAKVNTLLSILVFALSAITGFLVFLLTRVELVWGYWFVLLYVLFTVAVFLVLWTFFSVIQALKPQQGFHEIGEVDFLRASTVSNKKSFYRRAIITFAYNSALNSFRLEQMYRKAQRLHEILLISFPLILLTAVIGYASLPQKKPEYRSKPIDIKIQHDKKKIIDNSQKSR